MNETAAYISLSTILNRLNPYSIKPGLQRIRSFCKRINYPQDSFNSILIGGTNGKGSVCQMLTDVFTGSGYKTGTYTSPHLILLNERFKINNRPVSFERLLEYARFVEKHNSENLTYFEFLTAMAFLLFKEESIDMGILEVGMGGEFDATNVANPMLSIITSISMDHEAHLGYTLEEITKTKAGIIRDIAVISPNKPVVIETLKRITNAELIFVDEGYMHLAERFMPITRPSTKNIATTLLAVDVLRERFGYRLTKEPIKKSFWPGRFEVIKTANKTVIMDGAHNCEATENLLKLLSEHNLNDKNSTLVFASLKQKPWKKNISMLYKHFKSINLPRLKYGLSEEPERIREFLSSELSFGNTTVFNSVNECMEAVMHSPDPLCLITGSLYLVGEAKASSIVSANL